MKRPDWWLQAREARVSAPNWQVLNRTNNKVLLDGLSLAEATGYVRANYKEGLVVQRAPCWREPLQRA